MPAAGTLELHSPVLILLLITLPAWALESSVCRHISPESTHTVSCAVRGWRGPTLFSPAPCSCLHGAFPQLSGLRGVPWGGLACFFFRSPLAGTYTGAPSGLLVQFLPSVTFPSSIPLLIFKSLIFLFSLLTFR